MPPSDTNYSPTVSRSSRLPRSAQVSFLTAILSAQATVKSSSILSREKSISCIRLDVRTKSRPVLNSPVTRSAVSASVRLVLLPIFDVIRTPTHWKSQDRQVRTTTDTITTVLSLTAVRTVRKNRYSQHFTCWIKSSSKILSSTSVFAMITSTPIQKTLSIPAISSLLPKV